MRDSPVVAFNLAAALAQREQLPLAYAGGDFAAVGF